MIDNADLQAAAESLTTGPTDYYRVQKHGPITGSGPGFDDAMRKFQARQKAISQCGRWRYRNASWKHDQGRYIDIDYYLTDWEYLL